MTGSEVAVTELPGRWELLRAVGSMTVIAPPASDHIADSLGLTPFTASAYTELFVLSLPPYAGIHLGPEGKLGDEGADRVAGLWRALGLTPPADADHLGSLFLLYAELGEAADQTGMERTRQRLDHSRAALLWEHLWSWVPGYLDAACDDGPGAGQEWAELTRQVLVRETELTPGANLLPLALRAAPGPISSDADYADVLDALTAPVRTGFILTYGDLAEASRSLGLGLRRGERRFAVKAMLEQDAPATLEWLSGHAWRWAERHRHRPAVANDPGPWWAQRATHSADSLARLARLARLASGEAVAADARPADAHLEEAR